MKNNIIIPENSFEAKAKSKVYEIFKGTKSQDGFISKGRILGQARLFEGSNTYHVFIKSLLDERFFLLPENRNPEKYEYVILTREPSLNQERKYYWNSVGEGKVLQGQNHGFMKLDWDFFGSDSIYMKLEPMEEKSFNAEKNMEVVNG